MESENATKETKEIPKEENPNNTDNPLKKEHVLRRHGSSQSVHPSQAEPSHFELSRRNNPSGIP